MIDAVLKKIFGTKHERDVKRMMPVVAAINALEPGVKALGDADLRARSDSFRERLAKGETVDDLLPEAFAVCREAARRLVDAPFDCRSSAAWSARGQDRGNATGEAAPCPPCPPTSTRHGQGRARGPVNDYLATRRAWIGPLTISSAQGGRDPARGLLPVDPHYSTPDSRMRRAAHRPACRCRCDITYAPTTSTASTICGQHALPPPELVHASFTTPSWMSSTHPDGLSAQAAISSGSRTSTTAFYRSTASPQAARAPPSSKASCRRSRSRRTATTRRQKSGGRAHRAGVAPASGSSTSTISTTRSTSTPSTTSSRRCAPTRSTGRTSTTSSRTGR